jgi:hypothetical protein
VGGIERAGATSTGRGGATWRVGIGSGIGSFFGRGACGRAWALRAGVEARLTVAALFDFEGKLFLRSREAAFFGEEGASFRDKDPFRLAFTGNFLVTTNPSLGPG